MSEPTSALAHVYAPAEQPVAAPEPLIQIADAGLVGQITLRGDLAADAMSAALMQVVGLSMPDALTLTYAGTTRAVWMSPDELLLIVPYDQAEAMVVALSDALAGMHHMALNVSDARAVLRLSGAKAGEVLAKGAPCDCSDRGFAPGTARRTHMGGLAVGIWRLDSETWEVMCFRSYAHHLHAWLEQASTPGSEVDVF